MVSAGEKLRGRLYPALDVKPLTVAERAALVAVVEAVGAVKREVFSGLPLLDAALAALDEALMM